MDTECIYCYNIVFEGDVPTVDDDEMWDAIAPEHDPECEWVVTRAHRIPETSNRNYEAFKKEVGNGR